MNAVHISSETLEALRHWHPIMRESALLALLQWEENLRKQSVHPDLTPAQRQLHAQNLAKVTGMIEMIRRMR